MPLTIGARLGPYEIISPLGAGGMGEVFRARDTRLGRDVAIKALPAAFAQDPERLARFEREAKLLASLSHPNIAGIYGLEEAEGTRYLVLEFVEGETLAARLTRGPLPADEVSEICRQIAAGVEAAHEHGVIHRDLKPANIMLTPSGSVKVLDFGLAKANTAAGSSSNVVLSASPTMTYAATSAGVILGTAAYMSPEQARGRSVDRRTDVWSFGCVLYECLTGRQAYQGETVSDLIARILEREPDWSALPPATPPRIVALLRRCLTKDPTLRLRDIGEARIALGAADVNAAPTNAASSERGAGKWLWPAVAAALAAIATAAILLTLRPAHPEGSIRRFRVPIDGYVAGPLAPIALTRDGTSIAYEAQGRLWIRQLDRLEAVEIPGSEGGRSVFWSWDQKTLGFVLDKKLWTYALDSGQSRAICDIPENGKLTGGAWRPDGSIILAVWRGSIYQVAAAGGDVRMFMPLDSADVDYHAPSMLPDGRTLLVYEHAKHNQNAIALVGGSPPRLKRIYEDPKASEVGYSPTGHLLMRNVDTEYHSSTWALPFSASAGKVTGAPFLVLDGAAFASASNELLVAAEDPPTPLGQLQWMRPGSGGTPAAIGEPQEGASSPAISPDGTHVAYIAVDNGNSDVWVQDLVRGTRTRLTSSPASEGRPMWSRDGSRIYYITFNNVGSERVVAIAGDGTGPSDTLARGFEACPSPDGKSLVCVFDRQGNADLQIVHLDRNNATEDFLAGPSNERRASISPDGHWIAYVSDESGQSEVYLRRYPEGDARAQVSIGGGNWPRWMPRGDAIYYVNGDTVATVAVGAGPRPVLGLPRALLTLPARDATAERGFLGGGPIDAHPDGSRFIGVKQMAASATSNLVFIENWFVPFRKH